MYNHARKIAGVYAIVCTATDEKYVGCSKDVLHRMRAHMRQLGQRKHSNPKLQALYNKHGKKGFKFYLLADVPEHDARFDAEQFFIDTGAFRLNIGTDARACLGKARTPRPEGLPPFRREVINPIRVDPWA